MVARIIACGLGICGAFSGYASAPLPGFALAQSTLEDIQLRLDVRVPPDQLVRRRNEFVCIFTLDAAEKQPFTLSLVARDVFVSLEPLEAF